MMNSNDILREIEGTQVDKLDDSIFHYLTNLDSL